MFTYTMLWSWCGSQEAMGGELFLFLGLRRDAKGEMAHAIVEP